MDDRQLLRRYLRPAAKRLGIYFLGFGWHTFRRQNLTVIQEEGANPFEAMAQAGHSRLVMTGEYTIVGFKRREKAVRKLQQRLFQTGLQKAAASKYAGIVRDSEGCRSGIWTSFGPHARFRAGLDLKRSNFQHGHGSGHISDSGSMVRDAARAHARGRVRLANSPCRTKKRVSLYCRSPWSHSG